MIFFLFIARKLIIYAALVFDVSTEIVIGSWSRLNWIFSSLAESHFAGIPFFFALFSFSRPARGWLSSPRLFSRSRLDLPTSRPVPSVRSTFRAAPILSALTQRVLYTDRMSFCARIEMKDELPLITRFTMPPLPEKVNSRK